MSTLNQGQQEAKDRMFAFLLGPEKEMVLSGPAGTGKTYLLGQLKDEVLPRYYETCKVMGVPAIYNQVIMTATTNPAAAVLGEATESETSTIHSFLGLKVMDDWKTGKTKLIRTNRSIVHQNLILVIEEAYQADSILHKIINECTHNCKIIYVGDHCQLAPVMEAVSPITRLGVPVAKLTQPVRNADQPALMGICQQLRNTVETGIFNPIQEVPGVIDWLDDEQMQGTIAEYFTEQNNEVRILAYTNERVIAYNNHIRGVRMLPPQYQVGELLVNASTMMFGNKMLSVEEQIEVLAQSDETVYDYIAMDNGTEVTLEVRVCDIRARRGDVYSGVRVPVDRDHYLALIKFFGNMKKWPTYFKLKNEYPDFRPRDAATVHKAQGSTYDTVFIDLENLSTCHNPVTAARLLYVAFSRARNRVFLYGELAEKYGGCLLTEAA